MQESNPYAAPQATLADPTPTPSSRWPRYALAGLIALQIVVYAYFLPTTWEYIRYGAMGAGPQLFILFGQIALLIGALLLLASRTRGFRSLLTAGVLLAIGSLLTWRQPFFILPWLYRTACVQALIAAWVARRSRT